MVSQFLCNCPTVHNLQFEFRRQKLLNSSTAHLHRHLKHVIEQKQGDVNAGSSTRTETIKESLESSFS